MLVPETYVEESLTRATVFRATTFIAQPLLPSSASACLHFIAALLLHLGWRSELAF